MRHNDATEIMQDLFSSFHQIMSLHGIKWITDENRKVSVHHDISPTRPKALKKGLVSDLTFSNHELRKDLNGFPKHAVALDDYFQFVDYGPRH